MSFMSKLSDQARSIAKIWCRLWDLTIRETSFQLKSAATRRGGR